MNYYQKCLRVKFPRSEQSPYPILSTRTYMGTSVTNLNYRQRLVNELLSKMWRNHNELKGGFVTQTFTCKIYQ